MAESPRGLDSLARGIRRCRKCPLGEERTHAVPGEGPHDARTMLVGEAPGAREDAEGRPFVGRAGTSLDRILEEAGWDRGELFVTSSVKCRPPGNRTPRAGELDACREAWLQRQLEALEPGMVVLLGRVAARSVLGLRDPLEEGHGQVVEEDGRRFLVTYHPAGAMRDPERRRRMVEDLEEARRLTEGRA